jgi:hypothetical protein
MKRRGAIFAARGRTRGLAWGGVRGCLGRAAFVLGCVGSFAVAAAGAATDFVPQRATQLQVVSVGSDESVNASFSPRVAAPARLTFYVPQGYGLSLSASPGTALGGASAGVLTDSSPSSPDFATGDLTVGNPAFGADAIAQACSAGGHAAVWVASLKFEQQSLQTRVYVDATSGSEAAWGAFRLVVCLPSPFVPAAQGGAPLGAQFASFGLDFPVTNPPATGTYTWRMLVTPYLYGTATPDEPSTFEARARVLEPSVFTLKASYQTKGSTLLVSGRLLAGGQPRPGVNVDIFVNRDDPTWIVFAVWTARTRADGTYSLRKRIPQTGEQQALTVDVVVDPVPGPCGQPPVVTGGCVDESLSPPADPKTIDVKVPKLGQTKQGK